ncbi:S8 family serine peptidase [Deinococcus yunweiensis]|uniref:S8 family serine peptidase n=1 Tax=Deinococcus yunweiensis TaxID=367282 RepID=UPI00398E79B3
MTRLLRPACAAGALTLLLAGCQLFPSGGPGQHTIRAGTALTVPVSQAYGGTWTVSNLPAWANVSRPSGSGDIVFTLTVNRGAGVPVNATATGLAGTLSVSWKGRDGRSGVTKWPITALNYRLTGQITSSATVQGTQVQMRSTAPMTTTPAARGVIVTYRDGTIQAKSHGGVSAERALNTLRAGGIAVRRAEPLGARSALLRVAATDRAIAALKADPQVLSVTENAVMRPQATLAAPVVPTDQFAPLQWTYRMLGYPAVWRDMATTPYTRPVTVAVIDSGVRYDHPDLQGRLWRSGEGALDVLDAQVDAQGTGNGDGDGPDTDPTDPRTPGRTLGSHGTHVTGIIAARWGDNGATPDCATCSTTGVIGATNTSNVKVLPIRAIDADGNTDVAQVAVSVRYAAGLPVVLGGKTYTSPHAAQVINLSLGGEISAATAKPMCDAVADAVAAGSLVIVAAGNGYGETPYYPAACDGAVAVAAVTLSGASAPRRATYSNAYTQVQLAAPGGTDYFQNPTYYNGATWDPQGDGSPEPFVDSVLSTGWDYVKNLPNYEVESGTSQATPQVSALAALLISKGVTTGAAATLERLKATATDLGPGGRDSATGFGMINAAAALGAPAISDTLGLRLQDDRGRAFQPPLDAMGRFTAYVGEGTFRVIAGRDRDGNGVYGEVSEPRRERQAILGPDATTADVGELTPQ